MMDGFEEDEFRRLEGYPERYEDDGSALGWFIVALATAAIALVVIFWPGTANAAEIPEEVAVRVLIGEAGNQGEVGMIAVAEVLRKRGSTKGFYGLKAAHVDRQPAWVWDLARKAWRKSASTNYTKGATHFENVKAFGTPYWAKKMDVVFIHRDHTFYIERRG
jgi:hypothetical protein